MRTLSTFFKISILVVILPLITLATEIQIIASDGDAGDLFGFSSAISGDYLIIGAPESENDNYSGSAYIYKRDGDNWQEQQKLESDDEPPIDYFGYSVDIDGDYAIVGARGDTSLNDWAGAAYIFMRDGDSWMQQAKLTVTTGIEKDLFGCSVAIYDTIVLVGASREGGQGRRSGSVYVFSRKESNWSLQTKIVASEVSDYDNFAVAIDVHKDIIVVGAPGVAGKYKQTGRVYVYKKQDANWVEEFILKAADGDIGDMFGYAVSLSEGGVVIGAYMDNDNGMGSGSAYAFKRLGSGWSLENKLYAVDGAANDYFGRSVARFENYIIVGAPGVSDKGPGSGAVYSFLQNSGIWSPRIKKIGSDIVKGDAFGQSVALSKKHALVGAFAKKMLGHPRQGAAYVYDSLDDFALPVELSSFTAFEVSDGVALQWVTQSEIDNLGFVIDRSSPSSDWKTIASFKTHPELLGKGSSIEPTLYEFLDQDITKGEKYSYRLAHVNISGVVEYFEPALVTIQTDVKNALYVPMELAVYPAYPNPFNPYTTISYYLPDKTSIEISVFDLSGRFVKRLFSRELPQGMYDISWDATDESNQRVSSGIYFIQVKSNQHVKTQKITVLQ